MTETLTDLVTSGTYTASYTINLPWMVSSATAYVGFSAGTGLYDARQTVSNFVFEQATAYDAGGGAVAIDPTLALSDVGSATFASATVRITGNLHPDEDVLAFANNDDANAFGHITAVYTAATGTLVLTSDGASATLAQWQNALDAVTYSDSSDSPTLGARTISYQIDDGASHNNLSNVETASVDVIQPPVVDLGESATVTATPDDLQYAVFPNLSIDDHGQGIDQGIDHASVTWNNIGVDVGFVGRTFGPDNTIDGITIYFNPVTGGYDLTGAASVAAYEDVLSHLAANSWLVQNDTTFTVSVGEGSADSAPVTATINVAVPSTWDVWTGHGGDNDWNDAANWSLGWVPSANPNANGALDYAYIDTPSIINLNVSVNGNKSVAQLHVLTGATLEITSTGDPVAFTVAGVQNSDGSYAAGLHNDGFINVQSSATLAINGDALNDGTLEAQGPGAAISFGTGAIDLYYGSIYAFDGGEADFNGTTVNGGQILSYSDLEVSPSNGPSAVVFKGASLTDVELTGSPESSLAGRFEIGSGSGPTVFDGVNAFTIDAGTQIKIDDNATLELQGTINNGGSVVFNVTGYQSSLYVEGNTTLDNAIVNLSNHYDFIDTYDLDGSGAVLTLGSNLILDETGSGGYDYLSTAGDAQPGDGIINQGTINADSNFYINPYNFTNQGTINANGSGDNLYIDTIYTFTNAGTITITNGESVYIGSQSWSNTGSITVEAGSTLHVNGSEAGTGSVTIDHGGMAEFGSSVAAGQTITFNDPSGTLLLDNPASFAGTVAGLSGSGDVLDLRGFDAAHDTVVASTGDGSYDSATNTTSLVVTDQTTSNSVTLKLAGDYSGASWTVAADGSGGADVADPPASTPSNPGPVVMHDPGPTTIVASAPNETLTGYGVADNFVFNFASVGHDTVTDFHPTTDAIQFANPIFADAQAALNAAFDDGHGNTVIALDAHDTITLAGIAKAQLHVSDFHIV